MRAQKSKSNRKSKLGRYFYLSTGVGMVHVNMDPNADQETFDAVKHMVEIAYKKVK